MHIIKIGGNELDNPEFLAGLGRAVAKTAVPTLIVHGGGKAIAELQSKLGLPVVKVDGLRVTDADSLEIAQMVLSGQANKRIVMALLAAGVDAVGLSGVDGGLLKCHKKLHKTADLGFVGQITSVRASLLHQLMAQGLTVVLSPISLGADGHAYNVNADEAASAVALALQADQLDFVSNVPGVMRDSAVIHSLTIAQAEQLITDGTVRDGMIPKVRAALEAVAQGVPQARIVNLAGLVVDRGTWVGENGKW
jgi:acetylglutamate kinase